MGVSVPVLWFRTVAHAARKANDILPDIRDPSFQQLYSHISNAFRLRELIDRTAISGRRLRKIWDAVKDGDWQGLRTAFEDRINKHRDHFLDVHNRRVDFRQGAVVSFVVAGKRAGRKRSQVIDKCSLHLVHNANCSICRRLSQVVNISARGMSSLLRGRLAGKIIVYCDLKKWPLSLRNNQHSYHFAIYTECKWDEEEGHYVTERRIDLSFAAEEKSMECFIYVLACMLAEARITRQDDWCLYMDNEGAAVKSLSVVCKFGGFMVMQPHTGETAGPRTAEWPNPIPLFSRSHPTSGSRVPITDLL